MGYALDSAAMKSRSSMRPHRRMNQSRLKRMRDRRSRNIMENSAQHIDSCGEGEGSEEEERGLLKRGSTCTSH